MRSMSMSEQIRQAIEEALNPTHFELINESAKHHGHAGDDGSGETHFKLIIVSTIFEGQNRLARQRLVNAALSGAFAQGLHAVSMVLKTPAEQSA